MEGSAMPKKTGTWDYGYIYKDKRGREIYIIRQSIGGKQYEVSTKAHSRGAALKQHDRFEANPEAYNPRGDVSPDPIYLDEALTEEFLKWSRKEKQNTERW